MAQMQVSQGDCLGIGRVTPCPPDPEEDLEISENVRRFLTSSADLDSSGGRRPLTPPRIIPLAMCGDSITVRVLMAPTMRIYGWNLSPHI